MSCPNLNYLYAVVPPTVSDLFLSNFQDVLSLPSCTTYRPFFLYCWPEVSGRSWLRNAQPMGIFFLQIAPISKIMEISASFHRCCASIPRYVTIHYLLFLSWVYLSKRGVKSGQLRSSDVANNLSQEKDKASKMVSTIVSLSNSRVEWCSTWAA